MDTTTIDFRDQHSTVNEKGKRQWVYALQPKGKLYAYRTWLSYLYVLFFVVTPFISIDGMPMLQLNLPVGEFIFFGDLFTPQDFIVFGVCMLIAILFVVVFTLVYGRVFCGWICPQTIFMEMIFRKIEYWIEGTATQQRKNDAAKVSTELWVRKIVKHIVFFVLSFCIANIFLSYIIGVSAVKKIIQSPPSAHITGFISIVVFTLIFYAVYAFIREIVCTVICPYGRLQSVLVDRNSLTVIYDFIRGERRAKGKQRTETSGDCIDCSMCVQVCPTKIDIRNGTQLECINCTACIDACNTVMRKIGKPENLIRIDSENNVQNGVSFRISNRIKAYSTLLIALLILLSGFLVTRKVFDATILRVPGQIAQEYADGKVSNLYRIKVTNKANKTMSYQLLPATTGLVIKKVGKEIDSLHAQKLEEELFFLIVDKKLILRRKQSFELLLKSGDKVIDRPKAVFISNL